MKMLSLAIALGCGLATLSSARAAGPAFYGAVVDPTGTLLSGNAVRVVKNTELAGTYYVYFKGNVTGCPAVVSITGTGTTPSEGPAIATVGPTTGAPQAVAVQVRDPAGNLVSRGFQLLVRCFN